MIEPPIDKLIERVGCKFALVSLVSKRAHEVLDKTPDELQSSNDTLITYTAKEVYEGTVEARYED